MFNSLMSLFVFQFLNSLGFNFSTQLRLKFGVLFWQWAPNTFTIINRAKHGKINCSSWCVSLLAVFHFDYHLFRSSSSNVYERDKWIWLQGIVFQSIFVCEKKRIGIQLIYFPEYFYVIWLFLIRLGVQGRINLLCNPKTQCEMIFSGVVRLINYFGSKKGIIWCYFLYQRSCKY